MPLADAVLVILAYLIGSIPVGYLLVRLRTGGDLRHSGSGSTGATNAARVLGRTGFIVVFVLDLAKGVGAMLLVRAVTDSLPVLVLAGAAVVAGHLWPVWLGFRGGKGLATGYGACLAVSPLTGLIALVIMGILVGLRRAPLLATMLAVALAPLICAVLDRPMWPVILVMAVLILFGHRRNLAAAFGGGSGQTRYADGFDARPMSSTRTDTRTDSEGPSR